MVCAKSYFNLSKTAVLAINLFRFLGFVWFVSDSQQKNQQEGRYVY